MKVADTSLLVAAFATWHPGHRAADEVLTADVMAVEHALLETYSVLTRLPPPHRISAAVAALWLRRRLTGRAVRPSVRSVRALPQTAAALGISGGAVYDALIGVAARDAGALLLTRDRRAARTYDLIGARYQIVA